MNVYLVCDADKSRGQKRVYRGGFCEDDSLSSSDGGYGSVKADRPPRVYISPARDFAILAPSMHVPTPGTDSHPCSSIRHQSILVQSHVSRYFGHRIYSSSSGLANFEFAFVRELESRISIIDDEPPPLEFLSIDVFHRCLPLKTSEETHPLDKLSASTLTFLIEEVPINC